MYKIYTSFVSKILGFLSIQEEREERHKYKGIMKSSSGGIYESEDTSSKRKPYCMKSSVSCVNSN